MPINENINKIELHQVMEKVAEAKTREDKRGVLIKFNSLHLRDFLRGSFDDTIAWNLPEGTPPFEESGNRDVSHIRRHTKKLKYFVKGGPGDRLPSAKRERMFIQILEVLSSGDAELLCVMKDKGLVGKYKGLTKKLVSDTFPGLIRK
jgi:hypothetical protein